MRFSTYSTGWVLCPPPHARDRRAFPSPVTVLCQTVLSLWCWFAEDAPTVASSLLFLEGLGTWGNELVWGRNEWLGEITFFLGERGARIPCNKGPCLNWSSLWGWPSCWASRGSEWLEQGWSTHCMPVCSCAGLGSPLWKWPFPGLQAGSQGHPFAREHWGAALCTLYVSRLSLEL